MTPTAQLLALRRLLFGGLLLLGLALASCYGSQRTDDDDTADDDDATTDDDDATTTDDDDATTDDDDDATTDDDDATTDDDDDATTSDDDDATEPPVETVRFVAIGDTGEGNDDQYAVAAAMETVCAAQGCDFVILLGDNFYDIGVDSVDDSQWQDKFELPYANILLPFYPALGNHDGGDEFLGGAGLNIGQGDNQIDYSNVGASPAPWAPAGTTKWTMPARWYKHSHKSVDMYALDTGAMFFDGGLLCWECDDIVEDMDTWLQSEWAGGSTGTWRIAYGHHPYLSNGPHGNAGNYDPPGNLLPYVGGEGVLDFMNAHVCGNVDLYLSGHDHSRQWLQDTCGGTHLMVSGGGAKRTELEGSNPVWWQDADDETEGFIWIEIAGNTLTAEFWNKFAQLEYTGQITK